MHVSFDMHSCYIAGMNIIRYNLQIHFLKVNLQKTCLLLDIRNVNQVATHSRKACTALNFQITCPGLSVFFLSPKVFLTVPCQLQKPLELSPSGLELTPKGLEITLSPLETAHNPLKNLRYTLEKEYVTGNETVGYAIRRLQTLHLLPYSHCLGHFIFPLLLV